MDREIDPATAKLMGLGPLKSLTKGAAVYAEIRARILDATLAPGLALNQAALAEDFGISITPLREALRRLEGEGLVRVGSKSVSVVALTQREMADLRLVRLRLDPLAASLAAAVATPEQRARLSAQAELPSRSDLLAWNTAHRAFHSAIHELAGNDVLSEALVRIWDRLDRYRVVAMSAEARTRATSPVPHAEIAAAVATGDQEAAESLMFRHL
jgi:DNA-binding GntR family transcriptional regulator